MACPYFYPQEKSETKGKHPRLPLGDAYSGVCRVDPMRDFRPDEATQRVACNIGYPRHKCTKFPKDSAADAVRFSMTGDENGVLTMFFVVEQSHSPLEHGTLEYNVAAGSFAGDNSNQILLAQAKAYVDSYLRRKHYPEELAKNPHRR